MTFDVTHSSMEEQLALHGEHYATTVGYSMKPLFRNHGQTVKLVKYAGSAKRDDVIMWRDHTGKYLLHRVVRVTPDGYVTRGDNHRHDDPPVTHDRVVAVLVGYYKKEKYIPVTARRYRMYVRMWGRPNFLRTAWQWLRDLARRCLGKKPIN